jgi:hypothetical protein
MKYIENIITSIPESKVRFNGSKDILLSYKDLIEVSLDIVPQGGFTPKDIRERNRIQDALDSMVDKSIGLEDSDFEVLEKIIESSRWPLRDRDLGEFLRKFREGDYKK